MVVAAAPLVVGAIVALLIRVPTPANVLPTTRVERGDVRITVTESGELRAAHQATVSAPTDKQIVWLVPEGSVVAEGDDLVRFESTKYEIARNGAESALAVARADLQRALSDVGGEGAPRVRLAATPGREGLHYPERARQRAPRLRGGARSHSLAGGVGDRRPRERQEG
jgi:hypothetical protein